MSERRAVILGITIAAVLVALVTGAGAAAYAMPADSGGNSNIAPRPLPPAWSADRQTTPTPTPTPEPSGIVGSISKIFHIIQFPVPTMVEALQKSLIELFKGSANAAASVFTDAATEALGGGVYNKAPQKDLWEGPWNLVLTISAVLWPLTLALLVVTTAQNTSLSGAVGWADLKQNLGTWVVAGVLTVGSMYILNLTNGLSDEIAWQLLKVSITGYGPEAAPAMVVGTVFNTALLVTLMTAPGGLFFALFYIILGFTVMTALIGAYLARYALMYVLIVIAPLVITLGVLPPFRWVYAMWLKSYVTVALIAPVNALLIGLTSHAAIASNVSIGSGDLGHYFFNFIAVLGMLSLLITLDYEIARMTFGAVLDVVEQAKSATQQVITVGVAAVAGLATGGIGLGAASGASAAGATSGASAAGATSAASSAGAATEVANAGQSNAGANAMRSAVSQMGNFNLGKGLHAAGSVLRSSASGLARTAGAALESVGSAVGDEEREEHMEGVWQQHHAQLQSERASERAAAPQSGSGGQSTPAGGNSGSNRLLAGLGINPSTPEGQQMAGALTGLGQQYGPGSMTRAARSALLGVGAMSGDGSGAGAQQMAQALGYGNTGDMTRALVGAEMAARGDAPARAFPGLNVGASDLAGLPTGNGPTPQEYAYGGQMAANLRRLNPSNAAAYAGMAYGVRSASADPTAAAQHIAYLSTLPDQIQAGGVTDLQSVWSQFGQQASDYIHANNLEPSAPHESWGKWENEVNQLRRS